MMISLRGIWSLPDEESKSGLQLTISNPYSRAML